jgi:hypothetical protein
MESAKIDEHAGPSPGNHAADETVFAGSDARPPTIEELESWVFNDSISE